MSIRDWTPRRRGEVYCAPACGRGCTWSEYERALEKAQQLADSLGPNWQPKVWENLGWHYKARIPHVAVHQNGTNSFTAFFDATDPDSGAGTWTATADSPQKAVDEALREGERRLELLRSAVETCREAVES